MAILLLRIIISNLESQPVAWLLQRSYKPPKGSVLARMGSKPLLSAYCTARFAALTSTLRAHVETLSLAAFSISASSASVIRISKRAFCRSLAGLGGLPIRLFSMPILYGKKVLPQGLTFRLFVRTISTDKKTPVQPWRAATGRTIWLVAREP
jgi:hypothetical protein